MKSFLEFTISPSMRTFAHSPAVMCRSDAPRSIISSRSERRLTPVAAGAVMSERLRSAGGKHGTSTASCGGLPDDLLERGDALQDLQPAVHAQRQHAVLDGAVLDLHGAHVLEDQLAELRGHEHHFVQPLAALQPGAAACVAAGSLAEPPPADLRVERAVLEERSGFLGGVGLRVLE